MEINSCPNCKNYIGDLKCVAFLDGIPKEILDGKNPHEKVLKNQSLPVIFEQIKPENKNG